MTDLEYRDLHLRLYRLEQNSTNEFILNLYADLVKQHIGLLKDLVHNRFSSDDYENQMRLERDVIILEKNLSRLNDILSKKDVPSFYGNTLSVELTTVQ